MKEMKEETGHTTKYICSLFGKTSRAYNKRLITGAKKENNRKAIVDYVRQVRETQPRIGTKKLQVKLEKGAGIMIGRDALNEILKGENLLIRNVKKYRPKYTDGDGQSIYPDLRKGLKVENINQLWSSDITYINLRYRKFCYLVLIVDEYSHLIVGYNLSKDMRTVQVLKAMEMAVSNQLIGKADFGDELVIHSDRGSQYKSKDFKAYAYEHKILTSMCAKGKSHENPVAERLNGILKQELCMSEIFTDIESAKQAVTKAIKIYNEERPHLSCEMLTPREAHEQGKGILKKLWRQRSGYKSASKS